MLKEKNDTLLSGTNPVHVRRVRPLVWWRRFARPRRPGVAPKIAPVIVPLGGILPVVPKAKPKPKPKPKPKAKGPWPAGPAAAVAAAAAAAAAAPAWAPPPWLAGALGAPPPSGNAGEPPPLPG